MSAPPLRQNLRFDADGVEIYGYLALPEGGTGPGVVVIQEWWGLTDQIADVADQFAAAGFVALAPDLYGGRTTHDSDDAARLASELPMNTAVRELVGAVDYLLAHEAVRGDAVGAVGFCMGGGFVLALAAEAGERIAAAVPYYGVASDDEVDFSGVRADVLGHYGELDENATPARAEEIAARIRAESGAKVTIERYPAGHAFANEENHLGTYDPDSTRLAWERTLAFLRERLPD
ncbi:dienelactone hydrolase family protein [Streptomyces marispadix]|uniref:Dienelactone hydrolase family protein n=1 Tax=Streptomyces marispadix TaxID=2922868 RepID=A0ABS9SYJ7_9ACTN|nr:dienelactone hydrolase family protein [Streptomyces marispadix]MCH6161334.1 dienelactone hydrolase family protein [Streptomyces marispadix]